MNHLVIVVLLAAHAAANAVCVTLRAQETPQRKLVLTALPDEDSDSPMTAPVFRKVMSAPAEYDDNFAHAVIDVSNDQKSIISRNYIVVGSRAQIDWLKDHPERRGNRLFGLEPKKTRLTKLPDSTNFGFIPNSTTAWLLFCDSTVRFWDTRTHKKLDAVFPHTLGSECAGPNPAISPDGRIMATQTSDSLQFWDLKTFKAISPELEHDWVWSMGFSPDGKWLFTRGRRELKILEPKTGKLVAGPFRHDLVDERFAYSPTSQQLATFENNDEKDDAWKSRALIRSGRDFSDVRRVELVGHTREANWIDDKHLLVVADNKRPGQKPPFTYGRKLVYVVSLAMDKPEVQTLFRHGWISRAAVAPDGQHIITTTRDGTSCWKRGDKKPVWTRPESHRVSFGDAGLILLHRAEIASVCSLASGKELWRKDEVVASRLLGTHVWLCGEKGVEVWRVILQKNP